MDSKKLRKLTIKQISLVYWTVFFFSLLIFLVTLNKYVLLGDSGEFISAAFEKGIAHPPGYPLFTIIAHLFTKVPLGNITARVGFASSLFGAASAGLTSILIYKITKSKVASFIGGFALAFSSLFWLYSANAEIITLNSFLMLLIFLLALLYTETKNTKFLYLTSFLFGLSLANQYTVVAIIPAVSVLIFADLRKIVSLKTLLILFFSFLLGLTPYLYLPLAAKGNPYVNWGDPSSFERFFSLISRKTYGFLTVGDYQKGGLINILKSQIPFYLMSIFSSFGIFAFVAFFIGLFTSRKDKVYISLLSALLFSGVFLVAYSNFSITSPFPDVQINQRRTIQTVHVISFPFIAVFVGLGINKLRLFLRKVLDERKYYKFIFYLIVALVLAPPLINSYQIVAKVKNNVFNFYGESILESLSDKAILIVGADNTYIFWYLQVVENERVDVPVINFSMMQTEWYVDELKRRYPEVSFPFDSVRVGEKLDRFYAENIESHDIFFAPLDDQARQSIPDSYNLLPRWLTVQIVPKTQSVSLQSYKQEQDNLWESLQGNPNVFRNYRDLPTREILMAYARHFANTGIKFEGFKKEDWAEKDYERAREVSAEYYLNTERLANLYLRQGEENYERAISLYKEILRFKPNHAVALRNLGVIYFEKKQYVEAEEYLRKYINLEPSSKEGEIIRNMYQEVRPYKR